jgi:FkbM family methyltransferase
MIHRIFRFVRAISSLSQYKIWGTFTQTYELTKFDYRFSVSWSQAGEDLVINEILSGIDNGRYLDIGAHHPSRFSVTRHLFQKKWSGVNVDANRDLLSEFEVKRPHDVNLNYCVGLERDYRITIFKEPAISTIEATWVSRFKEEGNQILEVREVPGITLRRLIEENFQDSELDFLNVDIEGADLEALKSADFDVLEFRLWPKWVLLEAKAPISNAMKSGSVGLMIDLGYEPYVSLTNAMLLKKPNHKRN